jgi:DNA phosphorothioation-dependent restriction protein DptH
VPSVTPELDQLANDVYEAQPRGHRSHLAPFFAYSHRPVGRLKEVAERDVHLTLLFDVLQPSVTVGTAPEGVDSSSFFGLLTRLVSSFRLEERASWRHWLAFPEDVNREKHPAHGPYTTQLVDVQRQYAAAVARQLGGDGDALALDAALEREDIERLTDVHRASDWVMIVDRFLGIELYDAPKDPARDALARTYLIDHSPEFLDGIGHRLVVSTTQREEIEEILDRAMDDLGFSTLEDSVGQVLDHLKTVSGRLALRVAGDDARAREAVSLGVVVALLRKQGKLDDALLIPIDAHADVFGVAARDASLGPRRRCDLLLVRAHGKGLAATFVEVKARSGGGRSAELMHQMAEQMEATEEVFRDLFFRPSADARLDHVLQRARLASTLRFYADRAARHGLFTSDEQESRLRTAIGRLSTGVPELRTDRHGFVINLSGTPQPPVQVDGATVEFISRQDFADSGLHIVRMDEPTSSEAAAPGEGAAQDSDAAQPGVPAVRDFEPEEDADPPPVVAAELSTAAELPAAEYEADPEAVPPGAAIELGSTVGDQEPVTWRPSTKGSPHLFVLGIPGQGKSWTVTRLLQELAEQQIPAVVFDFHGQFAEADNPYRRAADPRVVDVAEGLPFSPFEADTRGGTGWRSDCFEVAEIFEYVCGLGDIQKDAVFEALVAAYQARGFGSADSPTLPTLAEVREQLQLVEENKKVKNLISRTRPLLDLGLFQEDIVEATDLLGSLQGGLIFDVHATRLETVQLAAGAFVLRKLYKDMFHWGEADRLRCVIVLDEAHRLAKDVTLPKIMKEGRKFGVGVVVASQGLNDFHQDVLGNAGTKVVFRTNHPSSRKVGGFLKGRPRTDLPEEIEQLSVGEALVQTPEMPFAEHVRMHPLDP